ncbi:cytosolic protein [Anaerobacillus sp. MEB173]|uniref:cytosolic protein n=1 Tax=Anaerobacillus sp. MEB173 TaxID=3383345 RepID=UPI003F917AF7
MYDGRDMTELSMMPKSEWSDKELSYFHHGLQQMTPYLNSEGVTIHREIIEEIEARGGLQQENVVAEHGSDPSFDYLDKGF